MDPSIMNLIPVKPFHGRSDECVDDFIESINLYFSSRPMTELYPTEEQQNRAKLVLLKHKLMGKAVTWAFYRPDDVRLSWEEMSKELKQEYDGPRRRRLEKMIKAEREIIVLRQGKLSLKQYIRKATRIRSHLLRYESWDHAAARCFIRGIEDMNTRLRVTQIGGLVHVPDSYTLSQAIEATRSFLRQRKWEEQVRGGGEAHAYEPSDLNAESSSSNDNDESVGEGGERREHQGRTPKLLPSRRQILQILRGYCRMCCNPSEKI
ncbi:uncharacterized protein H6S33_010517 [Morchella sextelata]|uniref:uncharacterized protein n=1 Tax=Morchella sextelata TaxID=1174677 RepID=UPI001D052999|nr:uncharacterized protein H6S33_010517 [Morchella sextelata]KAH0602186.1 hypothetical protein H6S33_010517 [Morchella sextelata]